MSMKFKLVPFLLLVSTCSVYGTPNYKDPRISGGELATYGEFPFIATISALSKDVCSGFIYSSLWIVTAASCVFGMSESQIQVQVGLISLIAPDPNEQLLSVLKIIAHPSYEPQNKINDVALLKVQSIVFGPNVNFIPYSEVDDTIGTAVTAGFGATMDGGLVSTKLRKTNLTVLPDCSPDYDSNAFTNTLMICVGSLTSSPCQYDEGSPLVQVGQVIGIMSKNLGCSIPSPPSVFTRIWSYSYFLLENAGEQPLTSTTTSDLPSSVSTTTEAITEEITTSSTSSEASNSFESTFTSSLQTSISSFPTAPCEDCITTPTTSMPSFFPTAPCQDCVTTSVSLIPTFPATFPTAPCPDCFDAL